MQSPLQIYASHIYVLDLKSLITHGDPKNADLLRTANVLGAVALGVVDALRAGSRAIMGYDGAAAAALSMIGHKPSLSVLHLSQVLEMSHPGTVRLVDNLVSDGLVERRRSARDARTVELRLTVLGEERRKAVAASREAAILATLSVLSADETRQLGMLLGRLLQSMPKATCMATRSAVSVTKCGVTSVPWRRRSHAFARWRRATALKTKPATDPTQRPRYGFRSTLSIQSRLVLNQTGLVW